MKPGYEPKDEQQALARLVEECGELQAALGKTLRFGLQGVNPELPTAQQETNAAWVLREAEDVVAALSHVDFHLHSCGVADVPRARIVTRELPGEVSSAELAAIALSTMGPEERARLLTHSQRSRRLRALEDVAAAAQRWLELWLHEGEEERKEDFVYEESFPGVEEALVNALDSLAAAEELPDRAGERAERSSAEIEAAVFELHAFVNYATGAHWAQDGDAVQTLHVLRERFADLVAKNAALQRLRR